MVQKQKAGKPVQVLLTPNYILYTGKFLSAISPFLASRFVAWLFLKPYRYKLPKREKEIDRKLKQETIIVPSIQREVVVYSNSTAQTGKKVLLAHGWSGRGTQMPDIALELINTGYEIISFDAPAHGKAPGKMSMMPHFIESILHLDSLYGPFYAAIGHSLGGMSLLKATKEGLKLQKLVIIGTANSVTHITREFTRNLQLPQKVADQMKSYFDSKFGEDMDNYSGAKSAKGVKVPTLVIHDRDDVDVHVSSAYEIEESLENGKLFITEGLGHRKVLGDQKVINKITTFFAV
jgi:pimeloyl-ACP methyl ester carboxylesterase